MQSAGREPVELPRDKPGAARRTGDLLPRSTSDANPNPPPAHFHATANLCLPHQHACALANQHGDNETVADTIPNGDLHSGRDRHHSHRTRDDGYADHSAHAGHADPRCGDGDGGRNRECHAGHWDGNGNGGAADGHVRSNHRYAHSLDGYTFRCDGDARATYQDHCTPDLDSGAAHGYPYYAAADADKRQRRGASDSNTRAAAAHGHPCPTDANNGQRRGSPDCDPGAVSRCQRVELYLENEGS